MKKIAICVICGFIVATSMISCGTFRCQWCGENGTGEKHIYGKTVTFEGITVCDRCYEWLISL